MITFSLSPRNSSTLPLIDASVISGNGLYYLDYGNNVVTLNVLAEDENNI